MKLVTVPALLILLFAGAAALGRHNTARADLFDTPYSMALDADGATTTVEATRTVSGTGSFHVGINVTSVGTTPYAAYQWEVEFRTWGLAYDGNWAENTTATTLETCGTPVVEQATIPTHTRVGRGSGCLSLVPPYPHTTSYVGQTTSFDMHCVHDGTFDVWLVSQVFDPNFYTTLYDSSANPINTRLASIEVTCTDTDD